jgi:6-phosphogluconolactonase
VSVVEVFDDSQQLASAAAEAVVAAAARACNDHGRFVWCLSGGNTPRALYELLAGPAFATRIDWAHTHIAFGDERCVAPDDPASNYRMIHEALLRHVPIPAAQLHRIAGEEPPEEAARAYEIALRALLGESQSGAPLQPFDLVLLGLGSDGHTASLFPFSHDEPTPWVVARSAQPAWRITLTPRALNATEAAWFLVSGADKAARVADVVQGPSNPLALPAQRIAPLGGLRWWLDRAAAGQLTGI